jgi:glucose-1-phosphate adenylyltransferase
VHQNLELVHEVDPDHLLVLAAHHVYKMDYSRVLAEHADMHADATVACIEVPLSDAAGFGVMGVDAQRRVTAFVEKPSGPNLPPGCGARDERVLASMGIYVFNTAFLYAELERDTTDASSSHDFGKDVMRPMVGRHGRCLT